MKAITSILSTLAIAACACNQPATTTTATTQPPTSETLSGTYRLVSSLQVKAGDTTVTTPPAGQETIKIFNGSHFAFFTHDLKGGKDTSSATFGAGSGTWQLSGDEYKEHLEYCSHRGWENKDFAFKLERKQDTLIQRGVEKIDSLQINHEIVEVYVRIK